MPAGGSPRLVEEFVKREALIILGTMLLGVAGRLLWMLWTMRGSGRTGMWDDEDDFPFSNRTDSQDVDND